MICVTPTPLSLVNLPDISHQNRVTALHVELNSQTMRPSKKEVVSYLKYIPQILVFPKRMGGTGAREIPRPLENCYTLAVH